MVTAAEENHSPTRIALKHQKEWRDRSCLHTPTVIAEVENQTQIDIPLEIPKQAVIAEVSLQKGPERQIQKQASDLKPQSRRKTTVNLR